MYQDCQVCWRNDVVIKGTPDLDGDGDIDDVFHLDAVFWHVIDTFVGLKGGHIAEAQAWDMAHPPDGPDQIPEERSHERTGGFGSFVAATVRALMLLAAVALVCIYALNRQSLRRYWLLTLHPKLFGDRGLRGAFGFDQGQEDRDPLAPMQPASQGDSYEPPGEQRPLANRDADDAAE
jgi:hypothetical protein